MARNGLFAICVLGFLVLGASSTATSDGWPHFGPFGGGLRGHSRGRVVDALETSLFARIKAHDPSPNWRPASLERLLVVPEHKLMLCYIDPSPLNAIVNDLNGLPKSEMDHNFGSGAISHFGWSADETKAALHSPEWFKVVFFSDPMERLLAQYLVECKPGAATTTHNAADRRGQNCLFFEDQVKAGMFPEFPQFVQTLSEGLLMETTNDGQEPIYNTHFVPQSDFCGGVNVSDYHYVGNLGEALEPQVKHILDKIGAPSRSVLHRHFRHNDGEPALMQAAQHPSPASWPVLPISTKAAEHGSLASWPKLESFGASGHQTRDSKAAEHGSTASWPKLESYGASGHQARDNKESTRPGPTAFKTAQYQSLTSSSKLASASTASRTGFERPSPSAFKQNFKNVDTILAARNLYDADYRTLQEVTGAPTPAKICLNTIFALNFEKRRILDWIAYHSLMGVDCFLLFHDNERSDVSDPEVRAVYDELAASPIVTLFQAKSLRDRGRIANTEQWFKFFPSTYLLVIDVDEFVVIDTPPDFSGSTPPNLFDVLENEVRVGEKDAVGVYLNRWDYGTGGYTTPPSLVKVPEFGQLLERWGSEERMRPEKNLGKMILNLRVGFPIFLSVHEWNHKSGGQMLFPNGTDMCLQKCGFTSKNPPLPTTRQRISLNHYATGSLSECAEKAMLSKFSREDRGAECARLHPGTKEHTALASKDGVVKDDRMAKYAESTRKRRADLFPGADAMLL